jgi:hypothetical protein
VSTGDKKKIRKRTRNSQKSLAVKNKMRKSIKIHQSPETFFLLLSRVVTFTASARKKINFQPSVNFSFLFFMPKRRKKNLLSIPGGKKISKSKSTKLTERHSHSKYPACSIGGGGDGKLWVNIKAKEKNVFSSCCRLRDDERDS